MNIAGFHLTAHFPSRQHRYFRAILACLTAPVWGIFVTHGPRQTSKGELACVVMCLVRSGRSFRAVGPKREISTAPHTSCEVPSQLPACRSINPHRLVHVQGDRKGAVDAPEIDTAAVDKDGLPAAIAQGFFDQSLRTRDIEQAIDIFRKLTHTLYTSQMVGQTNHLAWMYTMWLKLSRKLPRPSSSRRSPKTTSARPPTLATGPHSGKIIAINTKKALWKNPILAA
jgi:hypothetical protein